MKRKQPRPARRSKCCGVVMTATWCPRCSRGEEVLMGKPKAEAIPGPYHVENEPHNVWDPGGNIVARVFGRDFDDPRIRPTAALLAAAPALLALVKRVQEKTSAGTAADPKWAYQTLHSIDELILDALAGMAL